MDVPVADWVGEGGVKPAAQVGVGVKTMTGKKVALLVPVSDEVVMTNPAGLYDQLQQDLPPRSPARSTTPRSTASRSAPALLARSATTSPAREHQVALGTAAQATGGLYTDIVTGAGQGHRQELRLHRHRR
jgi:hypothetical protein